MLDQNGVHGKDFTLTAIHTKLRVEKSTWTLLGLIQIRLPIEHFNVCAHRAGSMKCHFAREWEPQGYAWKLAIAKLFEMDPLPPNGDWRRQHVVTVRVYIVDETFFSLHPEPSLACSSPRCRISSCIDSVGAYETAMLDPFTDQEIGTGRWFPSLNATVDYLQSGLQIQR